MKKQVKEFYKNLMELQGEEKLNISSIIQTIDKSNFALDVKQDLKNRVYSHKNCEFMDDEDEFPIVVVSYGDGENISLECENCYEVIIDSEILNEMI